LRSHQVPRQRLLQRKQEILTAKMKATMAAVLVMEKEGVSQVFRVPGAAINPLYAQ